MEQIKFVNLNLWADVGYIWILVCHVYTQLSILSLRAAFLGKCDYFGLNRNLANIMDWPSLFFYTKAKFGPSDKRIEDGGWMAERTVSQSVN
jgi:hypothetical protein